jgi:cytochrome P450
MDTKLPPGPHSALLGLDLVQHFKNEPLQFAEHLKKEFGDVVYLKIGPVDWFMLSHPDYVKEVFVTRSKEFGKTEQFKRIIRSVDGNGLVASEGDFWLKQRRTINPTFAHDKLSEYADVMAVKIASHIDRWKAGQELDIAQAMTDITLSVSAKIFLGVDVEGREREFGDAVTTVSRAMFKEFTELLPVPDWLPLPSKIEKQQAIKLINSLCREGIDQQKKEPTPGSMLNLLIHARDTEGSGSGMPEEQVMAEAMTMFNAGHDSTAAGLSWTWYELMRNPHTYAHLIAQTDSAVVGKNLPRFANLAKTPYSAQAAKEALRLYPPAWILPRQALNDCEVGGYKIPRGAAMNVFPFVIQRDERFFPDPLKYEPERFSAENEHSIYPFSWFPFGAGPRACIGREFALLEMQLILTMVTQRFKLEFAPGQGPVELNPITSLEPKGGIRVSLIPR